MKNNSYLWPNHVSRGQSLAYQSPHVASTKPRTKQESPGLKVFEIQSQIDPTKSTEPSHPAFSLKTRGLLHLPT